MPNDKKSCLVCNGNLKFISPTNISKFSKTNDEKNGYFICDSCGRSHGAGSNGEPIKRPWQ